MCIMSRRLPAEDGMRESGANPEQLPLLYVSEPAGRDASWSLGKPEKADRRVQELPLHRTRARRPMTPEAPVLPTGDGLILHA